MNEYVALENIKQELTLRTRPAITLWNRLEARPRTDNFDRALKAEVRDALWMLTKQWQMGEFRGDDAGSPITSKIHMGATRLTKYMAADHAVQVFDDTVPLEAKAEQRPIPFISGIQKISLDIRLLMGRQWLKMAAAVGDFKNDYLTIYKIKIPDTADKNDVLITAHREVWQQVAAAAQRCMDGYDLYAYLKEPGGHHAYDGIVMTSAQQDAIDIVAAKFIAWYEKLYYQPVNPENNAWKPDFLEYQFGCAAPLGSGEKVMTADEYCQGHLDWYNLDIDPTRTTLGDTGVPDPPDTQKPYTRSFIPVPVTFDGMPNTRWWTFEDGRTNFGNINPSTTDLGKLLLMEFGLVFANDWFLLPFTLDAGSIATVKGMSVTNVFGERYWIEAAGQGLDDDWRKWSMFTLNTKGNQGELTDPTLLVLPVTPKTLEGRPLEEIHFIRDEMANMVWAIEYTVPLATGTGKRGSEAADELKKRYQQLLDKDILDGTVVSPAPVYKADIRYEVMNSVPENWIPFIPARKEGSNRSIRLQRAAMPRILNGDPDKPAKIRPRTVLLREGLDIDDCTPYFINEEEVPRAGTNVYQSYQRSRWYNGSVYTWFGIRKQTGRGEGHSGLAFDQTVPVKKATE
ncbi:hypothetical protein [Chitinophaga sp. MM2321]|uniref:hypothetical protein n=1 Tax=Chitinophaga sp. MM2321 TaxID=3137178 RepID=UPI0032D5A6E1